MDECRIGEIYIYIYIDKVNILKTTNFKLTPGYEKE
jgi:hypothetical protein